MELVGELVGADRAAVPEAALPFQLSLESFECWLRCEMSRNLFLESSCAVTQSPPLEASHKSFSQSDGSNGPRFQQPFPHLR